MNEEPDQVNERGFYRLDEDVAAWLHDLAGQEYSGDVQQAMNESLRAMMIAMTQPHDPWAAVTWQARRRAQRSGRPLSAAELRQADDQR